MSARILDLGLTTALILLGLAMACAAFRIIRGPRAQDRVLGMDTLYLNGMLMAVVLGVRTNSDLGFEAALSRSPGGGPTLEGPNVKGGQATGKATGGTGIGGRSIRPPPGKDR